MRYRVVREAADKAGVKPFAFIIEDEGRQIEKRDFKTLEAAIAARQKFLDDLRSDA